MLIILDGGLGLLLQSRKAVLDGDPLWSARCVTCPSGRAELHRAHMDFLAAGADVIKTASYQMSLSRLKKSLPQLSQEECLDLMKESVRVARGACIEYWQSNDRTGGQRIEPKVAGSIGPYGACLADRSEYSGNYVDSLSEEELIEWHTPRLRALLEAGVDYLAVETIPALKEARAVLKLLHTEAPNVPTWISFSCQDGSRLCHGEDFSAAVKDIWAAKTKGLIAIGINCTEGKYIGPLLASLSAGDSIPLVLYPNFADGEIIKGDLGHRESLDVLAAKWLNVHSNIFAIGGCCGYFPTDISTLRASVFNGYLVHNSSMNPII